MEIKQGSLKPDLLVNLMMTDPEADPTLPIAERPLVPIPDLSTATAYTMDMRSRETLELVITATPMTLEDETTALCKHEWIDGETDHAVGKYDAEFNIIFPGDKLLVVPSKKFYLVEITETLNG
jgi:hypothetical protein